MLWDICEGNLTEEAGFNTQLDEDNQMTEKEPLITRVESDEDVQSGEESVCEESDGYESDIEEEEAELVEDIYGRTIDAKTGKVVKGVDTSKAQEKLQQLDEEESELTEEKRAALTKSIRSIFNRFVFIALKLYFLQIERVYISCFCQEHATDFHFQQSKW